MVLDNLHLVMGHSTRDFTKMTKSMDMGYLNGRLPQMKDVMKVGGLMENKMDMV